jgi:hypothetical protein
VQRDLSREELWAQSLARSRARREAAAARGRRTAGLPARSLSVAAVVAVSGGALAGATAIEAGRPDDAQARKASASVSRGGDVRALQRAIGVSADGVFGPATQRALRRWQRRHGLTADGIAGPITRSALGIGSGPVLKRGRLRSGGGRHAGGSRRHARRGGGVRALQRAIGVSADGVFGPATEAALIRWQRRHGLAADGVAGPQTRRALGLGAGPLLKRRSGGGGSREAVIVRKVIAAANRIATAPYRYGGGHASYRDSGYDCSGSISYALHGGGLLRTPRNSSGFMSYGAPGRGRRITIYANAGHAYMTIDGRRFDTSARSQTGSRWTTTPRSPAGYVVRHPPGL